jgi:hypothetical protein
MFAVLDLDPVGRSDIIGWRFPDSPPRRRQAGGHGRRPHQIGLGTTVV